MKKQVYEIREFSLIGKTLYTFREREDITIIDEKRKLFKDENGLITPSNYYKLVVGLDMFKKEDLFPANIELLPYKAIVTEDLPSLCKFKTEVYLNCQLMGEKHGGYLQFKDLDSNEVLRIAMNSHTYSPI